MVLPECPVCHQRASLEAQQLFCMNCGWNRDAAMAAVWRSIKMMPVGIALFAGFISFLLLGWHFRNPVQIAIFCAVPVFCILLNYFYAKKRLVRLGALPASPVPGSTNPTASLAVTSTEWQAAAALKPDPQYEALFSAPRPRKIRMAKRGRTNIMVGAAVVLGFVPTLGAYLYGVWARTRSLNSFGPKDWLILGLTALILLIPYGVWRSQLSERDLLENGEIAMGCITRQWFDESASWIQYEFKDFRGQINRGSGYDYTKKLYKDMAVPVFYDMNSPKHRVAYCSALHEVVL